MNCHFRKPDLINFQLVNMAFPNLPEKELLAGQSIRKLVRES
jgi:hypothetical protein